MKRICFSIDQELLANVDKHCHTKGIGRSEYIRAQLYKGIQH